MTVRGDPKYNAEQMAKELGLESETYRSYERGDNQPAIEVLAKIRERLGISLNMLICGEPDPAETRSPVRPEDRPTRQLRRV